MTAVGAAQTAPAPDFSSLEVSSPAHFLKLYGHQRSIYDKVTPLPALLHPAFCSREPRVTLPDLSGPSSLAQSEEANPALRR